MVQLKYIIITKLKIYITSLQHPTSLHIKGEGNIVGSEGL